MGAVESHVAEYSLRSYHPRRLEKNGLGRPMEILVLRQLGGDGLDRVI